MAQINQGKSSARTNSQAHIVKHAMRTIARAHVYGTGQGTALDAVLTASAVLRLLESLTAVYGPIYGGPTLATAVQLQRDLVAGLESAAAQEMAANVAAEIAKTGDITPETLGRAAGLPEWMFT